ncbi:GNAT family N-acetyltransferase [Flagellimonas sp.]|uniref:GNAT family N-acetyltransferase n=1 Tax=Flagellimonas sp. TaxID=2058762 RepID=UPI003B59EF42
MIEIIRDKEQWDSLVGSIEHSDFYHTYNYHELSRKDNERPVLIKYTEQDTIIAIPLLSRRVFETDYYDLTSVYGYPGPIGSNISKTFDNTKFKKELGAFLHSKKVVSVFSRLNPFINQQEAILKNVGFIADHGKVVNIDLTQKLEIQRQQYNKRLKTYINKSRRLCTLSNATTQEEIQLFIEMYYENMHRVNAKRDYFFDKAYFDNLLGSNDFEAEILLTSFNENKEVIAGALFVKKNNIVQYHLSGAREKYLFLNPVKLMIDEMRIKATKEGFTYFNLGGGVNTKEDSLFHFKSNFSKDFKTFKLWKYIIDEEAYCDLVRKTGKDCRIEDNALKVDFFPYYRHNI